MTPRDIAFEEAVISKLLSGVNRLVDTVRPTLGPRGSNVILGSQASAPQITNDGFAIATQIELIDPIENIGVQLFKEAAARTAADVGDGTTTALLLGQSILVQSAKILAAGGSATSLIREVEEAVETVIDELTSLSEPYSDELACAIAVNSAQDKEIGRFMAEAFTEATLDGIVEIQAGETTTLTRTFLRGMKLDSGYVSSFFAPDSGSKEIELEDPYLLLTTASLDKSEELVPIMERIRLEGKPLLILAREVKGEALNTSIINLKRGTLKSVCVQVPGSGEEQPAILNDVAVFTGAEVILSEAGAKLHETSLNQLGRARRIRVGVQATTILDGQGKPDRIQSAITQIESSLKAEDRLPERKLLRKRLAGLHGRGMMIHIGGNTDTERRDRQAKAERALSALRTAAEAGIVAGGGTSLLRAGDALRVLYPADEFNLGRRVVALACESIARQLAVNSGYEGGAVVSRIRASRNLSFGFNVNRNRFEDLLTGGIIDPLQVLAVSLRNAAFIATQMITARAAIFERVNRVKTEIERKYEKKGSYSVSRWLAWPPYGPSADDVRAFASLQNKGDLSLEPGEFYVLEAGVERTLLKADEEDAFQEPIPNLEFAIAVSAEDAKIEPATIQNVDLPSGGLMARTSFRLTFPGEGKRIVLVEFYCHRVWLGQIAIDVEITNRATVEQVR